MVLPAISPLTIQVLKSLDDLSPSAWDTLCNADDYFTRDYLCALAHAGLDCSFRYFLAYQGDHLVGMTFGYLTRFPMWGPCNPLVLIGGSPTNFNFPFAFHPRYTRPDVFAQLVQAMVVEARQCGASALVIRDFWMPEHFADYPSTLQSLGFSLFPLFQKACLDIQWDSFEGYLAALQHERRGKIRAEMRQITTEREYHLEIVPGPEIQPYQADLARLFCYPFRKYHDKDQLFLPESYFCTVGALPETLAFLLFRGARLASFILTSLRDTLLETTYSGVDYEIVGKDSAHRYIEYEIIRYASEQGFKVIDFGISNEAVKQRLGCSLYGLSGYLRPLSLLAMAMMKLRLTHWFLPQYGFKIASPDVADQAYGWVPPTVFKSPQLKTREVSPRRNTP